MNVDAKTKSTAEALMKKHNKKVIYVKDNGHMYFEKSAALISVGGDEEKLTVLGKEESKSEKGKSVSLPVDKSTKEKGSKNAADKKAVSKGNEGTEGAGYEASKSGK